MNQKKGDERDDFQDTVPFFRDVDVSAPVDDALTGHHITDHTVAASAGVADARSLRTARIAAVIDQQHGLTHPERPLPRIRRSELRGRRSRLLARSVIVAAAIIALVLFLHFVALPLSETGSL